MAIVKVEELVRMLQPGARLLGLDVGSKTVGLALSDGLLMVATPMETIKRGKFAADADRLRALIAEHEVGALVIGLPINLDGSEGPRAQSTRAFARNLAALIEVPLIFWDERLSTQAVERHLIEADASRNRRAEVIDRMAAAYILVARKRTIAMTPIKAGRTQTRRLFPVGIPSSSQGNVRRTG